MKKNLKLNIRVTKEEKEEMFRLAGESNLSVSDYVRQLIYVKKIPTENRIRDIE